MTTQKHIKNVLATAMANALSGGSPKTTAPIRQAQKPCRCYCHNFDWWGYCTYCGCDAKPTTGEFPEKQPADIREALPLAWLKPKNEVGQFRKFQKLTRDKKLDILAYYTALTLRPHPFALDGQPHARSLRRSPVSNRWQCRGLLATRTGQFPEPWQHQPASGDWPRHHG
jgi:hypothetical protein